MVMWETSLDSFITVIPTTSSSLTALLLKIPGLVTSVHIAIYLPTSGKEVEFVSALSSLDCCIDDILDTNPNAQIFIRGDANVNQKNTHRSSLFSHFLIKHCFESIQLGHPTYHHFLGGGEFDSCLDVLLHPKNPLISEVIVSIICKYSNPLVQSHHDIINLPSPPPYKPLMISSVLHQESLMRGSRSSGHQKASLTMKLLLGTTLHV